jgi:predicted membrane-bound spermidine synthase
VTSILRVVFFVSGAAALTFEAVWFQSAGLVLGSGVLSASIVLASFVAGLALGNYVVSRIGDRVRDPVRLYAALEVAIGVSGFLLVLAFPALAGLLGGLFGSSTGPGVTHLLRSAVSMAPSWSYRRASWA